MSPEAEEEEAVVETIGSSMVIVSSEPIDIEMRTPNKVSPVNVTPKLPACTSRKRKLADEVTDAVCSRKSTQSNYDKELHEKKCKILDLEYESKLNESRIKLEILEIEKKIREADLSLALKKLAKEN